MRSTILLVLYLHDIVHFSHSLAKQSAALTVCHNLYSIPLKKTAVSCRNVWCKNHLASELHAIRDICENCVPQKFPAKRYIVHIALLPLAYVIVVFLNSLQSYINPHTELPVHNHVYVVIKYTDA